MWDFLFYRMPDPDFSVNDVKMFVGKFFFSMFIRFLICKNALHFSKGLNMSTILNACIKELYIYTFMCYITGKHI